MVFHLTETERFNRVLIVFHSLVHSLSFWLEREEERVCVCVQVYYDMNDTSELALRFTERCTSRYCNIQGFSMGCCDGTAYTWRLVNMA